MLEKLRTWLHEARLSWPTAKGARTYNTVKPSIDHPSYEARMKAQGEYWAKHCLSTSRPWNAWLEHPLIGEHYQKHMLVGGVWWVDYIKSQLAGPARRSLDLGCASGYRSLELYKFGATEWIEGIDISEAMIAAAEKQRQALGAPGRFWPGDVNTVELPSNTYDLIFS